MPPKTKPLGWVGLILFVGGAAAIWWGLNRWERRAIWLRVEAPRQAVVGQTLPLRVRLAPLAEPTRLCADLHWGITRDTSMGFLSSGGTQAVGREGGTFDFELKIPPAPGMRFVTGVILLSRTGNWEDHTLEAGTEVIAVSSNRAQKAETRLEPLSLQQPNDAKIEHRRPADVPRWVTALLFVVAALATWNLRLPMKAASAELDYGKGCWHLLTIGMALACLWELFGIENWLGVQARAIARAQDLYYPRVLFQKATISVTIATAVLCYLFIRHVAPSHRLLLTAFVLYLAISAVNLVSWHAIDRVADVSWHGLSLIQALKLSCAALILVPCVKNAIRRAGRRTSVSTEQGKMC